MYVIATDPGTITTIQGVGLPFREPGSFHSPPEPHLHRLAVSVGAEHQRGEDELERTLFHVGAAASTTPPGDKPKNY